jgi:rRNA maturation endonuclease Nob1
MKWYGRCAECGKIADLAFRPGTKVKICAACMWLEDER